MQTMFFKNKNLLVSAIAILGIIAFFPRCEKAPAEIAKERGVVTDIQGNTYNTIKIGEQWWMVENLRVRVYNDSTPVTEVRLTEHDTVWANKRTGAFCILDIRYGLHYNWFAVTNSKKIAPAGWHIPSDEEWKILEEELGMSKEESDKTSWRGNKESEKLIPEASVGWPAAGSIYGSNESGFSALPGGCRLFNGRSGEVSGTAYWWSSTQRDASTAWYRNVSSSNNKIFRYDVDKNYGLTIRCVKDN